MIYESLTSLNRPTPVSKIHLQERKKEKNGLEINKLKNIGQRKISEIISIWFSSEAQQYGMDNHTQTHLKAFTTSTHNQTDIKDTPETH